MEHRSEIERKLGRSNYEALKVEIKSGKITKDKIAYIALQMDACSDRIPNENVRAGPFKYIVILGFMYHHFHETKQVRKLYGIAEPSSDYNLMFITQLLLLLIIYYCIHSCHFTNCDLLT